jgi:hypothetical protein
MAINVQLALSCGQEVDEKKIKSTVDYHGYRRTREVVIKISSGVDSKTAKITEKLNS